jgi:transposase-like protein
MDETYIRTRPKTGYLYRAVDKQGDTVDSLFQTTRGIAAAMAIFPFFRKAVVTCAPQFPQRITLDATSRVTGECGGFVEGTDAG